MVLRSGEIGSLKARIALALPSFQTSSEARFRRSGYMSVPITRRSATIPGPDPGATALPAQRSRARERLVSSLVRAAITLPAPPAFGAARVGNDPMMLTCVTVVPSISHIATGHRRFELVRQFRLAQRRGPRTLSCVVHYARQARRNLCSLRLHWSVVGLVRPAAKAAKPRGTGHGDRGAAVGDQRAAVRAVGAKRRSPLMTRRAKQETPASPPPSRETAVLSNVSRPLCRPPTGCGDRARP